MHDQRNADEEADREERELRPEGVHLRRYSEHERSGGARSHHRQRCRPRYKATGTGTTYVHVKMSLSAAHDYQIFGWTASFSIGRFTSTSFATFSSFTAFGFPQFAFKYKIKDHGQISTPMSETLKLIGEMQYDPIGRYTTINLFGLLHFRLILCTSGLYIMHFRQIISTYGRYLALPAVC